MAHLTDRERQWAGNQFGCNNFQTTEDVDRAYAAREADRKREDRLRQDGVIGGRYNDDPEPSQLAAPVGPPVCPFGICSNREWDEPPCVDCVKALGG